MAILFRSAAHGENNSATDQTVVVPSDVVDGDLLVATVVSDTGGKTITADTGTWIALLSDAGSKDFTQTSFYRTAASEPTPGSGTWSFGSGSPGADIAVQVCVFYDDGGVGTWTLEVSQYDEVDANPPTDTTTAVTVASGDLVWMASGIDDDQVIDGADPTNMTRILEVGGPTADDGTVASIGLATWYDRTSTGSPTYTVTWDGAGEWMATHVAVFSNDVGGGAGVATPGVIALTPAVHNPTVAGAAVATPGAIAPLIVLNTPTAAAPQTVTPTQVALSATLNTPTSAGGAVATPNQVALSAILNTPTGAGVAVATPAQIATAATLNTPTVTSPGAPTPAEIVLAAVLNTPTSAGGAVATPNQVALVAILNTPTTSNADGTTVTPAQIVPVLTVNTPTAAAPQTVTPAPVATVLTMLTPTLVGPAVVGPGQISLAAVLNTPTIDGGGVATPGLIAVVAVLNTPTPSNTDDAAATVTPATIATVVVLYTPTILVPVAAVVSPGNWDVLQNILDTARAELTIERTTAPTACPNDGQPLLVDDQGLYCPYDWWRPRERFRVDIEELIVTLELSDDEPPTACPNDGQPLKVTPNGGGLYCPYDAWRWPQDAKLQTGFF